MAIDPDHAVKLRRSVEAQLPKVVPAADAARLDGLNATLGFQAARAAALSLGRARAAAKYGTGSDQVSTYDARIAAADATTAALRTAREEATIQAPDIPAGSAGVFGRVVDADGAGIAGASVEALDANGRPAQRTASRDGGVYQLVLQFPNAPSGTTTPSVGTRPEQPTTVTGAAGNSTSGGTPAAAPAAPAATLAIRLRAEANGKAVVTSAETLTLNSGDVVFRVLTLQAVSAPPR